jgi:mannitol/fructose-specific phosphotransferase system IIA component (Ntr-type)
MKLHNLLLKDMVIPDLKEKERDDVLKEIVSFLKKKNKITKEKNLYEKLIQRENLGSTAIGDGVAIPHCKLESVETPLVLLAVSKEGVDFSSPDGKLSHAFFLVVSSPDNPSLNLQILAAIAHLVRKGNKLLNKILGAGNISAILNIIREEEEKLNEQ